jgi:hypothetical protein
MTLGDMFQEITVEFSQMRPTTLDELKSRTLDAIYRLGKALMQCCTKRHVQNAAVSWRTVVALHR